MDIFMCGDDSTMNNYCPISILLASSKVLEKLALACIRERKNASMTWNILHDHFDATFLNKEHSH